MMQSVCKDVLSLLPGPAHNLFTKGDHDFIRKAVIGLPKNEGSVVLLRFWNENSIEEIAGILNLNLKQVELLLHKAILRLKTQCLHHPEFSRAFPVTKTHSAPRHSKDPLEVA